jgi:hypothetical protein
MLATKSNSYTFQKGGIWYFSRRVPADLRRHYRTGRIAYSLRTKSIRDARVRAMTDAAKLDRHWHILRISSDDLPGKHLLADAVQESPTVASIDDHSFKAAVASPLCDMRSRRPNHRANEHQSRAISSVRPHPNTVSVPFFATPLVNKYWHSFRGPRHSKLRCTLYRYINEIVTNLICIKWYRSMIKFCFYKSL